MNPQLTVLHAEQHVAELRRAAEHARVAGGAIDRMPTAHVQSPTTSLSAAPGDNRPVTIRPARSTDLGSVREVALLDSQRPPRGPLLVAAVGNEIVAALVIGTGAVIANPFRHTAGAVALLRLRAEQLSSAESGGTGAAPRRSKDPLSVGKGPPRTLVIQPNHKP
jgi:hypothetical protein